MLLSSYVFFSIVMFPWLKTGKKDVLKQFRKLPGIRIPEQHIFIWLDLDPHLLISYIFCTFITLVQVE